MKTRPDYEALFSIKDGLSLDSEIWLKSEIAQGELAISGLETTPRRKIPFFHIGFSTDRESVSSYDFTLSGEGRVRPRSE